MGRHGRVALPILSGWRWVMLISPVFVIVLLTRISGIPMLEARGKKRWGDDPEFRAYTNSTPVLMPRPRNGEADEAPPKDPGTPTV